MNIAEYKVTLKYITAVSFLCYTLGQNPGKLPFQIFDENAGRSDIQKSKPSVTPFQINDETKENRQENLKKEVPFRIFQEAVRDERYVKSSPHDQIFDLTKLTLSRTTNFRLVQTERVCRQQFSL